MQTIATARTDSPIPSPRPADIDARGLRDALGRCPTGVSLVVVEGDCDVQGMVVGSFGSLSLDPPLVMWSVRAASARADLFCGAERFAVSVLSAAQRDVADAYVRHRAELLPITHLERTATGGLFVHGAAASFDCARHSILDAGDHRIVVGRVLAHDHATDAAPLIFCGGNYGRAA